MKGKSELELMKEKGVGEYLKFRFVTLKYSLQRGWALMTVPSFAIIGAGVMSPYVPSIPLWALALGAFVVIITVGVLDRYFGLLHAENKYKSAADPILREINDKLDKLLESKNG